MVDWKWHIEDVEPDDILDAVKSIDPGDSWFEIDTITDWTSADHYLAWANESLLRADEFGRNAAVSYSKRAVCREIDALLEYNHLNKFAAKNYPEKATLLRKVGLPVPDVVQGLVIDPRNSIEHGYRDVTQEVAARAVQIADMFLRSLEHERQHTAVISWAKSIDYRSERGSSTERTEFSLRQHHSSWLLIDVTRRPKRAVVIEPCYETLRICQLDTFSEEQATALATHLRVYFMSQTYSKTRLDLPSLLVLVRDLGLDPSN